VRGRESSRWLPSEHRSRPSSPHQSWLSQLIASRPSNRRWHVRSSGKTLQRSWRWRPRVFQVAGPPVQQFDLMLPTVPCGQQTGRCERVTVAMSASGPAVECHCRSTVLWWMVPVCMCPVVHCDDPPSNYRSVRLQGPWNGITDGTSLQFPSHAPPYPYEVPVPFLRPCVRETKDRHRRQWQKLLRNRCCKSGSARRCAWPYISGFRPRTLYHGEQHVFLRCSMHTMQCTRPWPSDFRNHLQLRSLKFLYRYANGFRQGKSVSLGFSPVPCVTR
jgi:hypothetical protein